MRITVIGNATVIHVCHESVRQFTSRPELREISVFAPVPLTIGGIKGCGISYWREEAPSVDRSFGVTTWAVTLNRISGDRTGLFRFSDRRENILHFAAGRALASKVRFFWHRAALPVCAERRSRFGIRHFFWQRAAHLQEA